MLARLCSAHVFLTGPLFIISVSCQFFYQLINKRLMVKPIALLEKSEDRKIFMSIFIYIKRFVLQQMSQARYKRKPQTDLKGKKMLYFSSGAFVSLGKQNVKAIALKK